MFWEVVLEIVEDYGWVGRIDQD